jgi:hypothetical protein
LGFKFGLKAQQICFGWIGSGDQGEVDVGGDWGALVVVDVYSMVALMEWCGHNRTSVPAGYPNETTLCCAFREGGCQAQRHNEGLAVVACRVVWALAVLHPVGQVIRPRLSLGPPCCSRAMTVSFARSSAPGASCQACSYLNVRMCYTALRVVASWGLRVFVPQWVCASG